MTNFAGGSAFAMARDIAEGYVLVSERTFRKMSAAQMNQLTHEVDRHMRELRGEAGVQEGSAALQARQRKIIRLRNALTVMRSFQQRVRTRR